MKKWTKQILLLILCLAAFLCMLPNEVSAANETSGTWGNLNWSYENNTLTITGSGAMPDSVSGYSYTYPWSSYSSRITKLVVGKGITTVGNAVFEKMTTLTEISLPATVTTIGDHAFNGCTNLRSVTIPNSVTLIDEWAFYGCTNLRTVKFGTGLKTIGRSAFASCTSLTSLTCPTNLETIGGYAFEGCSNLTSVSFNSKLKTIGYEAFRNCTRLTAVEIPASVTSLDAGSNFYGCTSLKTAVINMTGRIEGSAFSNCSALTSVTIADTVTAIWDNAFMHCSSLPEITIPGSVERIVDSAFAYCTSLKKVTLEEGIQRIDQQVFRESGVESIKIPDSVTYMEGHVFWNCQNLTTVEIGEGMSSVPNHTFDGCSALKTVKLGRFVSTIGQSAFYGCKNLTTINWPEFLTTIKNSAFNSCSSLTSVKLPYGVNYVDYNAFENCTALKEFTVPGSIISIGQRTFVNCKNLKTVKFEGNAPSIGSNAFLNVTANVYYPSDNGTWTSSVMKQYGGNLTWTGYTYVEDPTLSVSNLVSSGKIRLSWHECIGAAKYQVYRATSKDGTYKLLSTTTKTAITNTSADAGTTYYYKVRAVAADGTKSDWSNIVSRTCDLPRPDVTVTNVASTGKIKLTWKKIDGAVKYEIYRATSKTGTYTKLSTVTGTSLTNTSTTAGKTYYYKVRAIHSKSAANSAYSEIDSRTCDLAQPKVTVTNVASTGKIKLSWEKVAGAVKYEVYRATSKTGTYTKLSTVTGTSLTNTSVEAGKTYYYKVRAIHTTSAANSAYSEIDSRTCDLARPTLTVKLNSKGKPSLSWNKVDGAVKYQVYYATSKTGTYSLLKTVTGTSLTHSSAAAGQTLYYKVRAIHSNSAANSAYSEIKYITVK